MNDLENPYTYPADRPFRWIRGRHVGRGLRQRFRRCGQALLRAIKSKEVDPDDAYTYANDKRLFSKLVVDRSLLPKFETLE